MSDETPPRSAQPAHGPGHSRGDSGDESPLQARAAFLQNRSWESVVSFNRGTCERGGAQHGFNSESYSAVEIQWNEWQKRECTLIELLDFLRGCHRNAPFLFFNGNTFAGIGRQIITLVMADLPAARLREVISAVAHHIAGVLDRDSMMQIVESLCVAADLLPGTRVKTLRGSSQGIVVKVMGDGRIVWRTDAGTELVALPDSLVRTSTEAG